MHVVALAQIEQVGIELDQHTLLFILHNLILPTSTAQCELM